jgi:hypothetical protein
VLSRLISLLSRIPAVKWAFNRLRPLPHGGSIDVAQIAADEQPAAVAVADTAPALDTDISVEPLHRDGEVEVCTPAAQDSTAAPITAESPSAAPTDTTPAEVEPAVAEDVSVSPVEVESEPVDAPELASSDGPTELLTDVEPEIVEEAPVSAVEVEAIEAAEPVISGEATSDDDTKIAPVDTEQAFIAPVELETAPVEASEPVVEDEPASAASVQIEPVAADEAPAVVVGIEIAAPDVAESSSDSEPAPSVVTEIEPVVASDPAPVVDAVAEEAITEAPDVAEQVEPAPATLAPKSVPKLRARPAEPADRVALIRQRWAETGIRMWNPRLHGTGDATLNIQGRIGLLPPEPGETMPRYDKLEFKMLGGQVVCEGVIVEAPVHAGQRSFTRLAEPRSIDRNREPVRERQAALA